MLFSPEDHGYLIADPSTSRVILTAWNTTPHAEIETYVADFDEKGELGGDYAQRIFGHAVDGLWV